MKHFGLLMLLITAVFTASAKPGFDKSKRYHIVVRQHQDGCVTDGASAEQQTPVYYLLQATKTASTYWLFNEEQPGLFSIRNSQTDQYVTYDGVRTETRRYVSMTPAINGNNSLWTITRLENEPEGIYVIRNAEATDQVWDVREGSCIVGTYARSNDISWIESFLFYDEQGLMVTERAANDTGNGFDVSSWIDATAESTTGWDFEGDNWADPGFGNYVNGEASIVSPFLERWQDRMWGGLSDGWFRLTAFNTLENTREAMERFKKLCGK